MTFSQALSCRNMLSLAVYLFDWLGLRPFPSLLSDNSFVKTTISFQVICGLDLTTQALCRYGCQHKHLERLYESTCLGERVLGKMVAV